MKKHSYEININAAQQVVWDVLWSDDTYGKWTSVFGEGSTAESDWEEGGRIFFHDGKGCGVYSLIEKKDFPNAMVFKHLGEIQEGVETPFTPGSDWEDAREGYFLTNENGQTKVIVELDTDESFLEFMNNAFPKALAILKELAEAR